MDMPEEVRTGGGGGRRSFDAEELHSFIHRTKDGRTKTFRVFRTKDGRILIAVGDGDNTIWFSLDKMEASYLAKLIDVALFW